MAQHDYVIDNQSAPSARSDLNGALQAIVTQNSGASAPTTTYPDMFWYDTANNQIKKRNEANSAWITLGTIDEATGKFTPNSALTTTGIDPATLVVAAEGIASNNNDTTIPTSAAVKSYTDTAVAGVVTNSVTLLGTINTTSGSTQTLSGLTLTNYKRLLFVVSNITASSNGQLLYIVNAASAYKIASSFVLGGGNTWSGLGSLDLSTGISTFITRIAPSGGPSDAGSFVVLTSYFTSSTSVTFAVTNAFTGGSIQVWGVK